MAKKYLNDIDPVVLGNAFLYKAGAILTPAAFAVPQNDYNPTGMIVGGVFVKSILRLTSTGNNGVTGIQAPAAGNNVNLYIQNIGAGNIILQNNDIGSVAANRFLFNGNSTLNNDEGIHLWYDHISQRWREFARAI